MIFLTNINKRVINDPLKWNRGWNGKKNIHHFSVLILDSNQVYKHKLIGDLESWVTKIQDSKCPWLIKGVTKMTKHVSPFSGSESERIAYGRAEVMKLCMEEIDRLKREGNILVFDIL